MGMGQERGPIFTTITNTMYTHTVREVIHEMTITTMDTYEKLKTNEIQ